MSFLNSINIAKKLPTIIGMISFVVATTIGVIGYSDFRHSMVQETEKALLILTEERSAALSNWFEEIERNVRFFGESPTTKDAVAAFSSSFSLMSEDPITDRQRDYIGDNPHPEGQRDQLERAAPNVPYNFNHATYHPFFRNISKSRSYYDAFLFNTDGDLVYSVYKDRDFATNFVDGPYASSGLGRVFAAAISGTAGEIYFEDFSSYAPSNGQAAAFIATPILGDNGKILGVFAIQVPASNIAEILAKPDGLGETGVVYAVGTDFRTRNVSRFDENSSILDQAPRLAHIEAAATGRTAFFPRTNGIGGAPVVAQTTSLNILGERWGIVGEFAVSETLAPVYHVRNTMLIVTLLGVGSAVFLGFLTAKSVTRPLDQLGEDMKAVSQGNYARDISDTDRGDEIGGLARILVAFRDKLRESHEAENARKVLQEEQERVVERLSTALNRLADGDLTAKIGTEFHGDYDKLRKDYNRSIDKLNDTIGSVVMSVGIIRTRVSEMSGSSDELSRRTENQAATLEETAAALDEITTSVRSAASGAQEVEQIVSAAQSDADNSGVVVRNAVSAMTEIEQSSNEISQIIGVIDDIAFQTNLLALNAGVEAARAGDAGRGFAVVASEVRALAQRSSDAAKQIKDLINDSSQQVQRGVDLVGQAGQALNTIVDRIAHISGLVTEISSGAQEQSTGLGEINIGVTQLDKVTQQNAAMVDEATHASHALNQDAENLAKNVSQFLLAGQPKSLREEKRNDNVTAPVAITKSNVTQLSTESEIKLETAIENASPTKELAPARQATGTDGDALWEDF